MTKDEALRTALGTFEWNNNTDLDNIPAREKWAKMLKENIAVIKNALAQPEQKPLIWMYINKSTHETKFQRHMRDFIDHSLWSEVPLYGEPLANHELQCICGAVWLGDEMVHLPYKRLPPQRTWVGLSDLDMDELENEYMKSAQTAHEFLRAIEAALRSKNNG